MASNYGGQGANAFAQGLGQGVNTVQKAVSNQQGIDLKKDQAKARQEIAQRTKQQAMQRQEQMQSQQQTSQSDATAQNAETVAKTDALETEAKTGVKNGVNGEINNYKGAVTQEESTNSLTNTRAAFASNPAYAKAFGIQNTDTIQELDMAIPKDKTFLYKDFAERGASMQSFGLDPTDEVDVAEYDAMIKEAMPSMNYLKADGTPLDMSKLSIMTQAEKSATVEQKDNQKKAVKKTQQVVSDFKTKKIDDGVNAMALDLDRAGVPYDTSNLKTDEDKQEFIDQAQKKIRAKSFPTGEDADKYGTQTAVPESKTMTDEGLVKSKTLDNGSKEEVTVDGKGDGVPVKTTDTKGNVVEVVPNDDGATSTTKTVKADGTTEEVVTKNQKLGDSAKAPENTEAVEQSLTDRKQKGLGADETYMRHLYARAGMTYPIPDKGAKAKQYEFLVNNGLDKKTAMSWTFEPSRKTASSRKPTSYEEASKAFLISKKGQPTVDEWTQFNDDWATKSTGGVSDVKDKRNLAELERNFTDVQGFKDKYLNKPSEATGADLGTMKSIEQSNLQNSPGIKARTKDAVSDMELRHRTINAVDSLVTDLDGTLKHATKGPIENIVQKFKKVIGGDNMTKDMESDMKETINRDTRTGMILAEFIRMTSGLTVTDSERETITDIMTGGDWSDEQTLMQAIKAFRDQTIEQNDVIAGTLINDAPYSATVYRQYDTHKTADSSGNNGIKQPKPTKTKTVAPKKASNVASDGSKLDIGDLLI